MLVSGITGFLVFGSTASAQAPPTYRQQANRACQAFFAETDPIDVERTLSRGSWSQARRRAAADLRRVAAANARTDDRLAVIEHPASLDRDWRRMLAADRAGARALRAVARQVERAPTRDAGRERYFRGYGERYVKAAERFDRLARKLGLDGCLGADPTADLGLDPSATQADRDAAHAFAKAGYRARLGVKQQAPVIARELAELTRGGCERLLADAPKRAAPQAGALLIAAYLHALFDPLKPMLAVLDADLAAVPTADPALVAGRSALHTYITQLAALPPAQDACEQLRTWKADGWRRDAAPKPQVGSLDDSSTKALDARLDAMARRMRALGVPPGQIKRLTGDTLLDGVADAAGVTAKPGGGQPSA